METRGAIYFDNDHRGMVSHSNNKKFVLPMFIVVQMVLGHFFLLGHLKSPTHISARFVKMERKENPYGEEYFQSSLKTQLQTTLQIFGIISEGASFVDAKNPT